jgi:hypothetical protein
MKTVRLVAGVLFYLSRAASLLYFAGGAYLGLVLALAPSAGGSWPLLVQDGHFTVFMPFTRSAVFLGEHSASYIGTALTAIFLYALFAWLLSGVFNAFRKDRLFTAKNVVRLSRFYLFNLVIPVLTIAALALMGEGSGNAMTIALLHILAGVFAWFMAVIFRQGLILQEEQDLTL